MKIGRNERCPCGSGKKYKRCCINSAQQAQSDVIDDIQQSVLMNPSLTMQELNVLAGHKIEQHNERADPELCNLTPTQLSNWMYAPFKDIKNATISVPSDLSKSPVMRYVQLIIDEIISEGGSIKATAKGNLPAKLVKKASELLPEFPVSQYEKLPSISEFMGSNEDKFNALHYARILAEHINIISFDRGRFYLEPLAQKQYQENGIGQFFLPMLEESMFNYNWGYFDGWEGGSDLRLFWLFMIWRLHSHESLERLSEEMSVAFTPLLEKLKSTGYENPQHQLQLLIDSRFIQRLMVFWGFIIVDPRCVENGEPIEQKVTIEPLFKACFSFSL